MLKTSLSNIKSDLPAGVVVFLVSLPLCLGIALASGAPSHAPIVSGLIAGIIGGIIVGLISGSHKSVSGPTASLSAVVYSAITGLGAYETFLLAVVIAGALQIILGIVRAGVISNYFPSNVITGSLAGIGLILILKQIPHAFGYDPDSEGDLDFLQRDGENTFSEILNTVSHINLGAIIICTVCITILITWGKILKGSKKNYIPAPLIAVIVSILINELFKHYVPSLYIGNSHLVQIPIVKNKEDIFSLFKFPDFKMLGNINVYIYGTMIAIIASLETLLNLEATEKLDPDHKQVPANRELLAQGAGNLLSGGIGGLPLTSVVIRSSVNINAGGKTKLSSIIHGVLIMICFISIPELLNKIPYACLAGILIITGYKLVSLTLVKKMLKKGWIQFIPFAVTIICILFTNLIVGILCGLLISLFFVIYSNLTNPFSYKNQNYHTGDTIRIDLSQQVSFFSIPRLKKIFKQIPPSSQVILNASETHFIDHDILELIEDFKNNHAPKKDIHLNLIGFTDKFGLEDQIKHISVVTKEIQSKLTPQEIIEILKNGNTRFKLNKQVEKDFHTQLKFTSTNQYPLAAVVSCIDSRTPVEPIFDLGIGDVFSIRIAGNIINEDILGSLEYACHVAGSKLILVLGHTNCGAVKAACDGYQESHISLIINKIKPAVENEHSTLHTRDSSNISFLNNVTKLNVINSVREIISKSKLLANLIDKKQILIVGGIYYLENGKVEFIEIT